MAEILDLWQKHLWLEEGIKAILYHAMHYILISETTQSFFLLVLFLLFNSFLSQLHDTAYLITE